MKRALNIGLFLSFLFATLQGFGQQLKIRKQEQPPIQIESGQNNQEERFTTKTLQLNSPEQKGIQESLRLARLHQIEDSNKIEKLEKACTKYYKAKDLLRVTYGEEPRLRLQRVDGTYQEKSKKANTTARRQNPAKPGVVGKPENPLYRNRLKALETAYSEELREVLPQG